MDFSCYSGRNIKIAIIDSGVDTSHPDVGNICGGVGISLDKEQISYSEDYKDSIGHGTACAAIIKKIAPDAQIYIVKIFYKELVASEKALAEAIRWAVDKKSNVINLSLCTVRQEYAPLLQESCDYAFQKGTIIVSARDVTKPICYPSDFSNVISVAAAEIYGKYKYLHLRQNNQDLFAARGDIQKLAWVNPGYVFKTGSSYAAARITAIVALIMEANPGIGFDEVKEILIRNSSTEPYPRWNVFLPIPTIRHESDDIPLPEIDSLQTLPPDNSQLEQTKQMKIHKDASKGAFIQKAALYPYTEEMQLFTRFKELLNFEITGVADLIDGGFIGKDAGEVVGRERVGVKIIHSVEKAMEEADTLIIGHVDWLSCLSKTDILKQMIVKAIECGNNVYSLTPLDNRRYEDVCLLAQRKGVFLGFPSTKWLMRQPSTQIDVPVVGVFGTGIQQGKFAVQLALRKKLLKEGYKIGQIGTDSRASLFGFDICFPIDCNLSAILPMGQQILHFQSGISEICEQVKPDIIIVGAQAGVIPSHLGFPVTATLPSVSIIFGVQPDAYILVVDSIDSDEHIRNSIHFLSLLGKGRTIQVVMNDRKITNKPLSRIFNHRSERFPPKELSDMLKALEAKLEVPVTTISSEEGQEKLVNSVIDYFAAEN